MRTVKTKSYTYDAFNNIIQEVTVVEEIDDEPVAAALKQQDYLITFRYNGYDRMLANPYFSTGRNGTLLCGVEKYRGEVPTDVTKHYHVDQVEPVDYY